MRYVCEVTGEDDRRLTDQIRGDMFTYPNITVQEIMNVIFEYGYHTYLSGSLNTTFEALQAKKILMEGT
jgi:hypothetical protein